MHQPCLSLLALSACAASHAPAGPDCAAIEAATPGGFEALARLPVSAAIGRIPSLSRFAAALATSGMAESLDARPALTVFAPTDAAFASARGVSFDDPEALRHLVSWVVLPERLPGARLAGSHATLEPNPIFVNSAADAVNDGVDPGGTPFFLEGYAIRVVCGDIRTANATLYLTDGVPAQK